MTSWSSRLALVARLILGCVFLWAGAQKASNPQLFALDLEAYRLLPSVLILPIAYYLPWLEIVTGLSLFVPDGRRAALGLVITLLLVFTVMLAIAWIRGLSINCGCFGASGSATTDFAWAVGRNLCLIAVAIWVGVRPRQRNPASIH
jgi:putative oxidoreductase